MPKKTASQKRLEAVRHPLLLALKKIGPIFPSPEEMEGHKVGMHGQTRSATHTPFNDGYRTRRRRSKRMASLSAARNR